MPIRMSSRPRFVALVALGLSLLTSLATRIEALPLFARRYNLKCSACHTVVPVLNEQGYLFKRLGYHLPPALVSGQPAPTLTYLVSKEPQWTLMNNVAAAITDFGFQVERTTQEGQSPSSTSAFQVNAWNSYAAGWIPDTNFFYFSEFDIVSNGATSPDLAQAFFGYSGGNARNSWYVAGGRENLQAAEGTRAAAVYSLMPASPLLFETTSPTNFVFDQSPVGLDAGYTWASNGYKHVFAATAKVTNGDNADGSEILGPSAKNSKDVWLDLDWWYAPESGVTFVDYYGTKDQIQNGGLSNQFTYRPVIRRQGVFANYMYRYKIDVLGGYLRSQDDWQSVAGIPAGYFRANDFFVEADYYIKQGLALAGRYDLLKQHVAGSGIGNEPVEDWTAAVNKNLTRSGNIVARISGSYMAGRDPQFALKSTDELFQADIMFNF
jgi:hypothetical protein